MRAILREVAKCRVLLGQILAALDAIDKKLAELTEGPDQSSVVINLGPVSEQRQI